MEVQRRVPAAVSAASSTCNRIQIIESTFSKYYRNQPAFPAAASSASSSCSHMTSILTLYIL